MIPLSIYIKNWKLKLLSLYRQLFWPLSQIDVQRIMYGYLMEGAQSTWHTQYLWCSRDLPSNLKLSFSMILTGWLYMYLWVARSLRCIDLAIWWFSWRRQTKVIALPLEHACMHLIWCYDAGYTITVINSFIETHMDNLCLHCSILNLSIRLW